MKYRKILLAYNGSVEGKRALFECADLASFLQAETHLLAVASMPPSLFLTEGFVPEELLEEEKKRTQAVLDEGIRRCASAASRPPASSRWASRWRRSAALAKSRRRRPDRGRPQPEHLVRGALVEGLGRRLAARLRALQPPDRIVEDPEFSSTIVGNSWLKGRLEDDRMLTGQGTLCLRLEPPGPGLRPFPALGPRRTPKIVSIDKAAALAMPGRGRRPHRRGLAGRRARSRCPPRRRSRAAAAGASAIPPRPSLAHEARALRRRPRGADRRRDRGAGAGRRRAGGRWSTASCRR